MITHNVKFSNQMKYKKFFMIKFHDLGLGEGHSKEIVLHLNVPNLGKTWFGQSYLRRRPCYKLDMYTTKDLCSYE